MDTKTAFDKVTAAVGLAVLSPVFVTVAAINAAHYRDNPFYMDKRLGKGGEVFNMIKFRSMHDQRDDDGTPLPDSTRITPWGKFLQATAIDELPQLVNILKGDMSLVGPRPRAANAREEIIEAGYEDIFSVKPGLTGTWQVAAIGEATRGGKNAVKNELDAQYVRERGGMMRDLALMAKTIPTFVYGHNGKYLLLKKSAEKDSSSGTPKVSDGEDGLNL